MLLSIGQLTETGMLTLNFQPQSCYGWAEINWFLNFKYLFSLADSITSFKIPQIKIIDAAWILWRRSTVWVVWYRALRVKLLETWKVTQLNLLRQDRVKPSQAGPLSLGWHASRISSDWWSSTFQFWDRQQAFRFTVTVLEPFKMLTWGFTTPLGLKCGGPRIPYPSSNAMGPKSPTCLGFRLWLAIFILLAWNFMNLSMK